MSNPMPRIKGVEFEFPDGQKLIVPPLSLGAVVVLQERLQEYDGTSLKSVSVVIDALTMALNRNYPEITKEQVAEMVDLSNMNAVMLAVMSVSGMVNKDDPSGEAKAATL